MTLNAVMTTLATPDAASPAFDIVGVAGVLSPVRSIEGLPSELEPVAAPPAAHIVDRPGAGLADGIG